MGPGIEFLEYLAPSDGRPYPPEVRANDLVHWQTTLIVSDARAAAAHARSGKTRWVSTEAITLPDEQL